MNRKTVNDRKAHRRKFLRQWRELARAAGKLRDTAGEGSKAVGLPRVERILAVVHLSEVVDFLDRVKPLRRRLRPPKG